MRSSTITAVAALAFGAGAAPATPASPTATDPADVYAAQATALTEDPTSCVPGRAFDRYVSIVCICQTLPQEILLWLLIQYLTSSCLASRVT